MGQALNILLGWPIFAAAAGVASISAVYVTFGGQTSVIMTDLFQGVMLLITGLALLGLGIAYLGGFDVFWSHLPRSHRLAFPAFNEDPSYPAVGIFWQDAMANSAMFYFLNQGMVMRLMAARSVEDSRKAMITMLLVLMPVAALVVASGGWVGQALTHAGVLPELEPKEAFFITAEFLSQPGLFGLIMAALTAALMSTVDTLITAISAIVVNDVYKPVRPKATDKDLLRIARITSVSIAIIGVLLVPIFASFKSIYSAHGAFTAAVTPPLVVSLLLGVFWKRFTPTAACLTMVGGSILIFFSIIWPELITPFAHGVPMKTLKDPDVFLAGKDQYKFMRGLYGLVCCIGVGVISTWMTKAKNLDEIRGLVWGTIDDAIKHYKGSAGTETQSDWILTPYRNRTEPEEISKTGLPFVKISSSLAQKLDAEAGALLYISDRRVWLGGLRSGHAIIGEVLTDETNDILEIGPLFIEHLKGVTQNTPLRICRLY